MAHSCGPPTQAHQRVCSQAGTRAYALAAGDRTVQSAHRSAFRQFQHGGELLRRKAINLVDPLQPTLQVHARDRDSGKFCSRNDGYPTIFGQGHGGRVGH